MQPVEILEDLFFFQRGYLNANHFALRGGEPVLIDTAYAADYAQTRQLLQQIGIDPARVRLIVSTHTHCDHIGGNRAIQAASGCRIAVHHIGKHFMDTSDAWSPWWRYFDQSADFFDATDALEDGDTIEVGPHRFEVIYTPGHAADGIVLYHRPSATLISSDTLWEKDMAVMNVRVEGSTAPFRMLASLHKLDRLDVRMVYPGHGEPFSDVNDALERARQRLRWFLDNPDKMGTDLLKKIIVYTLMMRHGAVEETFFQDLLAARWFTETVDLYFQGSYEAKYRQIMVQLTERGVVTRTNGRLDTVVQR